MLCAPSTQQYVVEHMSCCGVCPQELSHGCYVGCRGQGSRNTARSGKKKGSVPGGWGLKNAVTGRNRYGKPANTALDQSRSAKSIHKRQPGERRNELQTRFDEAPQLSKRYTPTSRPVRETRLHSRQRPPHARRCARGQRLVPVLAGPRPTLRPRGGGGPGGACLSLCVCV